MRESRVITVVTVRDPGDLEAGVSPSWARFRFADPHEAWLRYHLAIAAGFQASAEKVRTFRSPDTDTPSRSTTVDELLVANFVDELEGVTSDAASVPAGS